MALVVAVRIQPRFILHPRGQLAMYAGTSGLLATAVVVGGPFLLLPAALAANAFLFSVLSGGRSRTIALAVPLVLTIVPPVLQLLGLAPRSYDFSTGTLCVVPAMVSLPEVPTVLALTALTAVLIVAGVRTGNEIGAQLAEQSRGLQMTSWQRETLVADADADGAQRAG